MALRQNQKLKQSQHLSPIHMQLIQLIELNSIELEERIKQELEENPALDDNIEKNELDDNIENEEDHYTTFLSEEEIIKGDYSSEEDMPDFRLSLLDNPTYDHSKVDFSSLGSSLHQSLLDQIMLRDLNDKDKKIAEYIIWNLDENGYLESTLQSISDDLIFQLNIDATPERIESVLKEIQDLETCWCGSTQFARMLVDSVTKKKTNRYRSKIYLYIRKLL